MGSNDGRRNGDYGVHPGSKGMAEKERRNCVVVVIILLSPKWLWAEEFGLKLNQSTTLGFLLLFVKTEITANMQVHKLLLQCHVTSLLSL
jgi:hypothetical protein